MLGIGACSVALKRLGIDVEIVDAVENDKFALASFNAIHETNFECQDIKNYNKTLKDIDLICHGSPCQDFSIAGKQAGGDIGSGTRSSLMYETLRIVEQIKPKYVLWENVKNILSKKHIHNFNAYIDRMKQIGYNNYYKVLNAKDYGVPQNRERVFTVSILKNIDNGSFNFPNKEELKIRLKDILENNVDEKYYLSNEKINKIKNSNFTQERKRIQDNNCCDTLLARDWKDPKCIQVGTLFGDIWDKRIDSSKRVYSEEGLSPTITSCQGGGTEPKIEKKLRIRKLTPKECWRLMGFSDEDFEKAKNVPTSNTQLYKQAGNSIVVNVLERIFEELFLRKE